MIWILLNTLEIDFIENFLAIGVKCWSWPCSKYTLLIASDRAAICGVIITRGIRQSSLSAGSGSDLSRLKLMMLQDFRASINAAWSVVALFQLKCNRRRSSWHRKMLYQTCLWFFQSGGLYWRPHQLAWLVHLTHQTSQHNRHNQVHCASCFIAITFIPNPCARWAISTLIPLSQQRMVRPSISRFQFWLACYLGPFALTLSILNRSSPRTNDIISAIACSAICGPDIFWTLTSTPRSFKSSSWVQPSTQPPLIDKT